MSVFGFAHELVGELQIDALIVVFEEHGLASIAMLRDVMCVIGKTMRARWAVKR
tara:strand:+ start:15193 stop:15354 length:162 start_codon:yes stop_codon:yes gene_type:complete